MSGKKEVFAEIREDEAKAAAAEEKTFSKEQLLSCERFSGRRDILNALLEDGRLYTASEAEKKTEKFMKGQVK